MPDSIPSIDLLIIGGGIAGCWTLAQALESGLNCLLVEKDALGSGQTIASQGIIHGGLKYALGSVLTRATQSIKNMPERWQQSLSGDVSPNLTQTSCLSHAHYFIPTGNIDSQLVSFLGSKLASSYSEKIPTASLGEGYQQVTKSSRVYRLNEFVLDTHSLLTDFLRQYSNHMVKHYFDAEKITATPAGFHYQHQGLTLNTRYVLNATGNDTPNLPLNLVKMQQRPLQMVMMKGDLPTIFGHFISQGSKPLLTVTSYLHNGEIVWYMGGELAESGASKTKQAQISHTQKLLSQLVPKINIESMTFDTLFVNRAEPKQSSLLRPDDAYVSLKNNWFVGFPTKLAFAPRFADQVISQIIQKPSATDAAPFNHLTFKHLPPPKVAAFPWAHL